MNRGVHMTSLHRSRCITSKVLGIVIITGVATLALAGSIFIASEHGRLTQMFGQRLEAIAATAAQSLSGEMGDLHRELTDEVALSSDAWARWRDALNAIRETNRLEEDIYTFRRNPDTGAIEFVARSYDPRPSNTGVFIGETYEPMDASQTEALERALAGAPAHTDIYSDSLSDRLWITAFAPIRDSTGAIVGAIDVDIDAREHSASWTGAIRRFIAFGLLALVAACVLGVLLASTMTRPLQRLTRAAAALGRGDFDHPLEINSHDEIGQLAASFECMRRDLKTAQSQAMENMRLGTIGRMASGIIHDFKSPMTAIAGYSQLLIMSGFSDERRQQFHEGIQRNIDVMVDMAGDLLAYSRGETALNLTSIPAADLIADVASTAEGACSAANVMLCLDSCCGGEVRIDVGKMRRVLLNLLTNAREAMVDGGEIHLISRESNDSWQIMIRDNGPGIPEELRDKLFEPFTTHGKKTGTGLGLALVKLFVEQHGGEITVQSTPGEGTEFAITLPMKPAEVS